MAGTVHRTVPTPRQYVGLPGKPGNANTKEGPHESVELLLFHKYCGWNSPPDISYARIPQGDFLRFAPVATLDLPGKPGNASTQEAPHESVELFFYFEFLLMPASVHRTLFIRQDPTRGLPPLRSGRNT